MNVKRLVARVASVVVVVLAGVAALGAQAQTASDFYTSYRAAFAKAKAIEQMFPLISKDMRAEIEKTPAAERPKMFEFVKEMSTSMKGVKVVKETKNDTGVMLTVEALDGTSKMAGQVQIVKEGDAWKMGKESWSSK